MKLTELRILMEVSRGECRLATIATALKKDISQIYRSVKRLKQFVSLQNSRIEPKKQVHVNLLLQLLEAYPPLIKPLSDCGMGILTLLLEPKTTPELIRLVKLKRSTVYKKLKEAYTLNLVTKQHKRYSLNTKIWPLVREFLEEYKKYNESVDERVPANATIYRKTEQEIIFSTKQKMDATPTAFSAYEQYDLKLLLHTHYYFLPKRPLSITEVFLHSLDVTEKEHDLRSKLYAILFYAKHKSKLKKVKHSSIVIIQKVLRGERVVDYPSLKEIQEKADIYDIGI